MLYAGAVLISVCISVIASIVALTGACGNDSEQSRGKFVMACNLWLLNVIVGLAAQVVLMLEYGAASAVSGFVSAAINGAIIFWWRTSAKEYQAAFNKQQNQQFSEGYGNTQQFI